MNSAIVFAYAWLGLSLSFLVLGLALEFRHSGPTAWLVIAGSFGMLTWTAYNLHPTLTLIQFGSDVPKLQSNLAVQERRISDLNRSTNEAIAEANLERMRNADLQRLLSSTQQHLRRRHHTSFWRLRRKQIAIAANIRTARALGTQLRALKYRSAFTRQMASSEKHKRITTTAAFKLLKRRADRLRWGIARVRLDKQSALAAPSGSKPIEPTPPTAPPRILSGKYFTAELTDSRLINGRTGVYYKLRLVNQSGASIPIFNLGDYQLHGIVRQQLIQALLELKDSAPRFRDIGKPTLLIRGLANAIPFRTPRPFSSQLCSGSQVIYLPGTHTYQPAPATMLIPTTYQNDHLPNLRAAYVSCIASAELGETWPVSVLQGSIRPANEATALAAEFYLFLASPAG